ncbi:4-hydroxythreonine-4-phosphate dehydrogenase PdxA [Terrihabitans rhizophilus]|uniref:4-hydroxythreonine-4-phosphate dehydrogenase n=1 Tax=Terrihabitans rhizophilus TaxID=3092662 RepID=A0ABU4RK84_9HYPH|nr:4-hydroxythreonine-4-phosphate dehydrogenase PdxA [Terrihabitans sp. PJ23]MDX6805259.1 4-hydroxythreonine-4-phosphate dehydrogenase PdxA [Terrihabitans sp. PJ23]
MSAPLALTMGEPAGIGPELALKAWVDRQGSHVPPFAILADPDHLATLSRQLGLAVPIAVTEADRAQELFPLALPVIPLDMAVLAEPGIPNAADAPAVIESIRRAVELTYAGKTSAVVTNPIAKAPLLRVGFPHPGHTDYLGVLAEQRGGPSIPVMMLWCEDLAVVPVTVHIPLAAVPAALTTDLIVQTARIVAADLRTRFHVRKPRIAVAGLNPHAGEEGAIGLEDRDIIEPAVQALVQEGIAASGPFPADTLFHAAARENYDVVLAMYHDQALIPIKTLAFDRAVNVTLGLPFVRTSPDHGTAFDIAGQGRADPSSLIAALKLAAKLAARQAL